MEYNERLGDKKYKMFCKNKVLLLNKTFRNEFTKKIRSIQHNKQSSSEVILDIPESCDKSQYHLLYDRHVKALVRAIEQTEHVVNRISLYGHPITDLGADLLASTRSLHELDLSLIHISPSTLHRLGESALCKLILDSCINMHSGNYHEFSRSFRTLQANSTIQFLSLVNCQIPDNVLADLIAENKSIKHLILPNNIGNEAIRTVGANSTIKILTIPESNITNEAIKYVAQNNSVHELNICACNIDEQALGLLLNHQSIRSLSLIRTKINECEDYKFKQGTLDHLFISNVYEGHKDEDQVVITGECDR